MKKRKNLVASLREKKENKRFSLKLKWAVGTAVGVLLIFSVFATLLFQSFSSLMLRQEQQYASDALSVAANRLASLDVELTEDNARQELSSGVNTSQQEQREPSKLYSNSVFVAFSRKNIGVGAYNLNGQKVFSSRKIPVKFDIKETDLGKVVKSDGTNVYVERRSVVSRSTRKVIGYVQVTNRLLDYDNTRQKLFLIFIVFGITAAFACAILGYVLASWLLRPIDDINETISKINGEEEGDPVADIRVPLVAHNDELTDLSRTFNNMLDRMQRYIEQQQQFVEDVSHELRTPVAIIQGHLELLNRWGKDDPKVLAESISASLQEITRMKSLVQEMLDLSRAEQVEIHFGKEITDAREVALQVFNNFKMIHPDFVFLIDDDLGGKTPVKIYRNHLEQVLIILMDNAVKYSRKRKEVHLSVSKNARVVDLAVQDFGEGIAQKDIGRVFNRFYRVDKARSRDAGGNGLGLSIAQRLIEGYHGQLTVESVLGQGSIFRISLPLINEQDTVQDNRVVKD